MCSCHRAMLSGTRASRSSSDDMAGAVYIAPTRSYALAVFLFPWVLVLRTLGVRGIVTMVLFLAILGLGWLYAYRERILEWH